MIDSGWQTLMVELLRFGGDQGLLRKDDPYLVIRANERARKVEMELDHQDFLDLLDQLRYVRDVSDEDRGKARDDLAGVVTRLLALGPLEGTKVQVDLVVTAQELSALPFEAAIGDAGGPVVLEADRSVEITRRVRGAFHERAVRWPAKPRMLLAAAAPEAWVPTDDHQKALEGALKPWIEPLVEIPDATPNADKVLKVLPNASLASIREEIQGAGGAPYTHVHVLAHGVETGFGARQKFGLRLRGSDGQPAATVTGDELADALSAGTALPVVVSVTACNSGNVGSTIVAGASVAQTIHTRGVPIVLGSQFPLTVAGSIDAVEAFYGALFAGEDVRDAVHAARRRLADGRPETLDDWLSLVGYVQLPEGYADRLVDARLEAAMASLRTAQAWADHLAKYPQAATPDTYDSVADKLRERIASLRHSAELPENARRPAVLEENRGLLGSAYKRLAELQFARSSRGLDVDRWKGESREALAEARRWYELAGSENLSAHWVTVQLLSLETVLDGRIAAPWRWHAALEAAETASRRPGDVWGLGSCIELRLLAQHAGEKPQHDQAAEALRELRRRAADSNPFAIEFDAPAAAPLHDLVDLGERVLPGDDGPGRGCGAARRRAGGRGAAGTGGRWLTKLEAAPDTEGGGA